MIKNNDPFPNINNPVEKSFEFPLLKEELFVGFIVFDVLCLFENVDKITALLDTMIETAHRIRQKCMWILGPSDPSILVRLYV